MNGYVRLRKWRGLILGALLIVSVFATSAGATTWTHSVMDGYDVWYLNGTAQKFRYNLTNQQWSHFSDIGSSWYTISSTGQTNTFIGNGGWYDLGNGFSYQYSAGYDKGSFREGSADRFSYKYASGQWWHTGDTISWKVLGAGGVSGAFLGSGSWYDLGNGFTYQYSLAYHKGTFKDGSAQRFLYKYASGQWYHSADALSWQVLGIGGLDAAFIGNAHWNDLGNGFTYQYSRGYDKGTFRDGAEDRFLYKYVSGQWYHSADTLSWQVLGVGGRNAAFVGSGAWYDLGNGFTYQYSLGYDKGTFKDGSTDRFLYKYASGQWYHTGDTLSWQVLGAGGRNAAFVGSGSSYDLGTWYGADWWYTYDATTDRGQFGLASGANYRFAYSYVGQQWNHYGSDGWRELGNTGYSAAFIGDGSRHNVTIPLGDTWWYAFDYASTTGSWFTADAITAKRFTYGYLTGTWSHFGPAGTAGSILATGLSADFIGNGNPHDLNTGWTFTYLAGEGLWADASADRFRFTYSGGQWWNYDYNGDWNPLGAADLSSQFLGDGASTPHDLGNGWGYRYGVVGIDEYYLAAVKRFSYDISTGVWTDYAGIGGPQPLGASGLSGAFIGDGSPHEVVSATWWYRYNYSGDSGEWYIDAGTTARLSYAYENGQWYDFVTGRGWKALGATGQTITFIGDGVYRNLGDGYQYKYEGDRGYFLFDTAHDFRQSYASGAWEYFRASGWAPWAPAQLLQDINPGGNTYPSAYSSFVVGGYLYFIANDGAGLDLYRWDGITFEDVSGNQNLGWLSYMDAVGSDLYFVGGFRESGADPWQYDLYRWNGTTFEDISGNQNFTRMDYVTTLGSDLFFTTYGGAGGSGGDLYRWNGTLFEDVSGNHDFPAISWLATLGTDLFFKAGTGSSPENFHLYRWDGTTFADISGDKVTSVKYVATIGTDLFFAGCGGTGGSVGLLYRWDGASFDALAGSQNFGGDLLTIQGTDLWMLFQEGGYCRLYRWDGSTFSEPRRQLYGSYGGEYMLYYWGTLGSLFGTPGSYPLFMGYQAGGPIWELLMFDGLGVLPIWSGVGSPIDRPTLLSKLGETLYFCFGGDLYRTYEYGTEQVTAGGWSGGRYLANDGTNYFFQGSGRLYRWDGTTFEAMLGPINPNDYGQHVCTVGTNLFFTWPEMGSYYSYLYRWDGTTLENIFQYQSGGLSYFTTVGTNPFFWYYNGSGLDLYRWDGATVSLAADVNSPSMNEAPKPPIFYGGDVIFGANTSPYGSEPWRLWATHMDFLMGRMP